MFQTTNQITLVYHKHHLRDLHPSSPSSRFSRPSAPRCGYDVADKAKETTPAAPRISPLRRWRPPEQRSLEFQDVPGMRFLLMCLMAMGPT